MREVLVLLERMEGEIRCRHSALPECCLKLGKSADEPFGSAFLRVHERYAKAPGESFPAIFEEELGKAMRELPLEERDRRMFLSVVSAGGWDVRAEESHLASCREELSGRAAQLERERESKCRLAVGLGAMSGILLVLILL